MSNCIENAYFLSFRNKSSEEQALLLRTGPRKNIIAKLERNIILRCFWRNENLGVSIWIVGFRKGWESLAKNGLQELGTALVGDRGAEVARQEPDSDDQGDHDGDDADDVDTEPLYDGVDGSWFNKLVNGGLGDDHDDDAENHSPSYTANHPLKMNQQKRTKRSFWQTHPQNEQCFLLFYFPLFKG